MRFVLIALLFMLAVAQTAAQTFWVPATADIYLAGQPIGTVLTDTLCNQSDVAPAQAAFEVTGIPLVPGSRLAFAAAGQADHIPDSRNIGPEGKADGLTSFNPYTGVGLYNGTVANQASPVPFTLSGHANMPIVALIGVFTSDVVPLFGTPSELPPSVDYAQVGLNFHTFSPELRQIFFGNYIVE